MINICTLSDNNYLLQGLALYESLLKHTDGFALHYLCLDDESFEIVKKHENGSLFAYHINELLEESTQLQGVFRDEYSYFCWCLASYFSNCLINKGLEGITYMDSDIFFHDDFQIVLDAIGEKQVGIFRHRQFPLSSGRDEGLYNVGVVHFKDGKIGRKALEWWSDAVLYRKHPHLAGCGDQGYLNEFPTLAEGSIFADEGIGHGAPWMWQLYDLRKYKEDGTINWEGEVQKLIFTHFSQFIYKEDSYIATTAHWQYTPYDHYIIRPDLKHIYDEYYQKVKEAKEKYT